MLEKSYSSPASGENWHRDSAKLKFSSQVHCWKSKPQSLELLRYNAVKLVHSRSGPKFQYQCFNVNKKSIADK